MTDNFIFRLISASGDGCIFVWRVPHDMVVTMHARLSQQAMRQGKQLENEVFSDSSTFDFYDGTTSVDTNYRYVFSTTFFGLLDFEISVF